MLRKVPLIFVVIVILCIALITGCKPVITSDVSEISSQQSSSKNNSPVTISTSFGVDELTEEVIAEFQNDFPNITVNRITMNTEKLMAMIAAGSAPDVWRCNANEVPMFATRGLLLPIDDYIENSDLDPNDFAEVMKYFQYDGKSFGQGPFYGLVKGWTTDHSLWINKKIFEENNLSIPSTTEPMTFEELFELSKKLLKKDDSGNVTTYGFATWCDINTLSTIMLKKMDKSFWSEDFKESRYSSEEGIEVIKYWTDFAKTYASHSTLNPIPCGWGGPTFLEGKVGIVMLGYNLNTFVKDTPSSKDHVDDFVYLPSPVVEGSPRKTWIVYGASGGVINKDTKHPDEAFAFLKWYLSGKQSEERAKAGWDIPPYKSMVSLLPVNTDFDRRCMEVMQDEAKYMDPKLEVNPFVTPDSVGIVVKKYTDEVLYDNMTVEDACVKIDEELALLIQEGMEIAGVN